VADEKREVSKEAVPARGVSQLAGYILNEAPFTAKTELREWIETWLDAWCPLPVGSVAAQPAERNGERVARAWTEGVRAVATFAEETGQSVDVANHGALPELLGRNPYLIGLTDEQVALVRGRLCYFEVELKKSLDRTDWDQEGDEAGAADERRSSTIRYYQREVAQQAMLLAIWDHVMAPPSASQRRP
jgi:hypothetical protein